MQAKGVNGVGRIIVDVEVANNDGLALMYRGLLQPEQVRRETIPDGGPPDRKKPLVSQGFASRCGQLEGVAEELPGLDSNQD